nr:hypothetical protein [Tanacetum cinerariifolium]
MMLCKALENSMNRDHSEELAKDLAKARKKKKNKRDLPKTPPGSPPHQPHPPPPPAGLSGASGSPRASGSSQVPPPTPPPPSTNQEAQSSNDEDIRNSYSQGELTYQMDEYHILLTDSVDDSILRHNVSKPLPLGGPPGQVTIQSDFFFNKDLEYLRYDSKGGRPALSISKMKAAYYPDVGLKQMVPDQMWIEEE